jgi:hypothetical protein
MTIKDWARVLLRAADIAEKELGGEFTHQEWANYRLLRWLSDAANEIVDEDEPVTRITNKPFPRGWHHAAEDF